MIDIFVVLNAITQQKVVERKLRKEEIRENIQQNIVEGTTRLYCIFQRNRVERIRVTLEK